MKSKLLSRLSFGRALEEVKKGGKIARAGWNGANQFIIMVPASPNIKPVTGTPYSNAGIVGTTTIQAHLDLFNAQGNMQPGWVPSQGDLFADDWMVID